MTLPAAEETILDQKTVKRIETTEGALQAAARIKVLLEPGGRIAAVSGLAVNDGATSLLTQLGAGLASIDPSPILLMDGNFRSPRVHTTVGVSQAPGLLDVLEERCGLESAIRATAVSNLHVLPLGESKTPLARLLSTPRAEQVFAELREGFRFTLVDAGVALATPESILLTSISDGVVLGMGVGKHRQHEVIQFGEALSRLRLRLIGVVLTQPSKS